MSRSSKSSNVFGQRLLLAQLGVLAAFTLLIARLWFLQGIHGSTYRDLSENNRLRTVRTHPPRGTIFDREGRVIVKNRPSFNVEVMLEDVQDKEKLITTLSEVTGVPVEELQATLASQRSRAHFQPKLVIADAPREILAKVKANTYRLPGVIIGTVPTRTYPLQGLASQLLGYTREVTRAQLNSDWGKDFKPGDIVGQSGIETRLEHELHGRNGFVQVEVDATGHRRQELGIVENQPGNDLTLTIDLDLQKIAEESLADKRGAVVALDPNSGEILALASAPTYDVNLFSGKMELKDWTSVAKDPEKPLTNRTIASRYPPGSTYKLLAGVAGLAEGIVSASTELPCPGYYKFAGRRYHCHKRSGHGSVNLKTAIKVSCNAYFYQLGSKLGIEKLAKYGRLFGLGSKTGIELQGEDAGTLPSEEWKLKQIGERWYPGETLSVAIGQGYLSVTPIQMAVAVAALANGGTLYKPHLVKKVTDTVTGSVVENEAVVKNSLGVSDEVLELVREYAASVVNDERGTGGNAKLDPIIVAGKTGTAQVSSLGKGSGEEFQDHAWFVSFAPLKNPQIAMAVIVENSGHGGAVAAPVTKNVMKKFFAKKGITFDEDIEQSSLVTEETQ